jgi:hypothetical protein
MDSSFSYDTAYFMKTSGKTLRIPVRRIHLFYGSLSTKEEEVGGFHRIIWTSLG